MRRITNVTLAVLAFAATTLEAGAETEVGMLGVTFTSRMCSRPMIGYPVTGTKLANTLAIQDIDTHRRDIDRYMDCINKEMKEDVKKIIDGLKREDSRIYQDLQREHINYINALEAQIGVR